MLPSQLLMSACKATEGNATYENLHQLSWYESVAEKRFSQFLLEYCLGHLGSPKSKILLQIIAPSNDHANHMLAHSRCVNHRRELV